MVFGVSHVHHYISRETLILPIGFPLISVGSQCPSLPLHWFSIGSLMVGVEEQRILEFTVSGDHHQAKSIISHWFEMVI